MASRLPLVFVLALSSGALVSCLAGSDDDEASPNNAGSGGAAAGSSGTGGASGGSGGATGGSAGSGTGGATGGTSGSGTGGKAMGGTSGSGTGGATGESDMGGSNGGGRGGSTGGSDAGSGGSTAGTGGVVCCLAIPVCSEGETEVAGPDACPPSATCRELTLCCSTIWCASSEGSAGMGGKGGTASCDPALEHDRDYVADSPAECAVILYGCPDHTEAFSNDCGCGCEQSADCPEFVDCMPGPDPRPGCTADERARCPYTDVAF